MAAMMATALARRKDGARGYAVPDQSFQLGGLELHAPAVDRLLKPFQDAASWHEL